RLAAVWERSRRYWARKPRVTPSIRSLVNPFHGVSGRTTEAAARVAARPTVWYTFRRQRRTPSSALLAVSSGRVGLDPLFRVSVGAREAYYCERSPSRGVED